MYKLQLNNDMELQLHNIDPDNTTVLKLVDSSSNEIIKEHTLSPSESGTLFDVLSEFL